MDTIIINLDFDGNTAVTFPLLMGVTVRPAAAGTVRVGWVMGGGGWRQEL